MSKDNSVNSFSIEEIQNHLNLGFWDLNLKTNEVNFSDKMLEIFGLPVGNKYQLADILKIISKNDRERFNSEIGEILIEQKPFILEFRITKSESILNIILSGSPIIDKNKQLVRIVGLGQEITNHLNVLSFLKERGKDLERIQRIANIGNWSWDIFNKEFKCDEAMYAIFDTSPQQINLNLKKLRSFFSPMEWKKCLVYIRKHLKLKKKGWFEQKIFSGAGKQKEVAIFFEFEFDEAGIVQVVNGIVQDVTDQKRVHEQLRYRIEFERMVGAISSNFINLKSVKIDAGITLALDIIGNFMNVNRSYLFLFLENNSLAKLCYQWHIGFVEKFGEDQQVFEVKNFPYTLGTLSNGETLYIEDVNLISKKFSKERDFLLNLGAQSIIWVPLNLEGKVIGVLGFDNMKILKPWSTDEISLLRICGEVFVNALSRKNFEVDIKGKEEHLSIVVDSIGDAVIALDNNHKIVRVNTRAENLTGYHHDELVGKLINEIIHYSKENDKGKDIVLEIMSKNKQNDSKFFWNLITKDNHEVPVMIIGSPLKGENIGVIGTVLVCHEMTNQLKLEEQLRHSEKMRAIGQLSGGIAHDFNNLLTGIIGCANYLKKHMVKNEKLLEYVENILITGRRAATLTSQLLAFSRHEKPRLSEIDIHFLISEVVELLKHTIDPRIRIHKQFNSTISNIEGDESQLHNAILNLAVNSRDAMPQGGDLYFITEEKEFVFEDCVNEFISLKPGKYLVVSIKDTGSGIPLELMSHIFEPFFTTKEKGKGTGLGLAAVYGTVLAHRGCITVQSELNAFTEFSMYLPTKDKKLIMEAIPENWEANSKNLKHKILVVDDEILLCSLACEFLSDAGYVAVGAFSGEEALNIFQKDYKNIDLVVVDMLMPNMTGPELLDKLYQINPALKSIIISGFTGNIELSNIIKSKKVPFLQKPYDEKSLLKLVEQIISK